MTHHGTPDNPVDEDALRERLHKRYADRTDHDINLALTAAVGRYAGARVTDFLPVLVEREARRLLTIREE